MGKVIQFRPLRIVNKPEARTRSDNCPRCLHKLTVHITHPNGVISCAARGCTCERRPQR